MSHHLEIPTSVRHRALGNGGVGARWLADLPDVLAGLAARWSLDLGSPFSGGTAGYLVSATQVTTRRACVLKVALPLESEDDDAFARSVLVHQLDGGVACAELLEHDIDVGAMLLERLGPSLGDLRLPLPRVLEVTVETLLSLWRTVPGPQCGLPTGEQKATWLASYIPRMWQETGRPCDKDVIDRAVSLCAARATAFDDAGAVLVHGDAHEWNTLATGHGSFKLVDPEGLRSEPAHDLSVPMRESNTPLLEGDTARLVRARAEALGDLCRVDPEPIWQWGFVERVSTGLTLLKEMDDEEGLAYLEVAARSV